MLTALPVILLAAAAVPGSWLVAKLGARRALMIGLVTIAVGGAARGVGGSLVVLFVMTFVMGCGVAISQPSLPSLVRAWLSESIGLATATFANGMLMGEIVPVALTAPLFLPLLDQSWGASLALWSIPVMVVVTAIALSTTDNPRPDGEAGVRWWPSWGSREIWLLGLILGGASTAYWCANAFIPDFLRAHHSAAYITAALTALNLIQLPASFLVAAAPAKMIGRSWPLGGAGVLTILSTGGLVLVSGSPVVVFAGVLGFSTALVFVLALSLPPLLADPGDTHRFSAAMFTISYACPFLGSLLGGVLWDASGIGQLAFVPIWIGGAMVLGFPRMLDLKLGDPESSELQEAVTL